MTRCALVALLALSLAPLPAAAQAQRNPEQHGRINLVEVSSAELPSLLQIIQAKIGNLGFADKWQMPVEVLGQDLVVAEEITLYRGKRLVLAPRNADGQNMVLFIGKTIKVEGNGAEPMHIVWERNPAGLIREPVKVGKASNGLTGEREGADGKPGTDGVSGNRGIPGKDAPTVIFIALKLEAAGPIRFQLSGQDGAPGGPGQEGGDGGPGRAGRPGFVATNQIGVLIKGGSMCGTPVRGGNGGAGGNGGPGGPGGPGGDAGNVVVILPEVHSAIVRRFVDPQSEAAGGKGGARGARGVRGKGGAGAPAVPGSAPCEGAPAGNEGPPGQGRAADAPAVPDSGAPGREGEPGAVIYSRLSASQAKSIGLLVPDK